MDKFLVIDALVPVRKSPDEKSEMVTQLLFGDEFICVSKNKTWAKIKSCFDNYEGYVDVKFINQISSEKEGDFFITKSPFSEIINLKNNSKLLVPAGSVFRNYNSESKEFKLGAVKYRIKKGEINLNKKQSRKDIIELALSFLNAPYLWGGMTIFGIDCSGFTQVAFKIAGYKLLRDASQQATQGKKITRIEEAQMGDLLFFGKENTKKINHVGLYLGDNKIIHASGKVKINKFDNTGILNTITNTYTHYLRLIKLIV